MPQTQFIDRAVVLPGVLRGRTHSANRAALVVLVAVVDVPVIMQLVFQQSRSYVFCAAFQFLDRVSDIPVVPQKGDSTLQSLNKVVYAVVHDKCQWCRQCRAFAFTDEVVDIPVLVLRSGGASDSAIDRVH